MIKAPKEWCDPPSAFGQLKDPLTDKKQPVQRREWLPPDPDDALGLVAFRAAVTQSVTCLWVRTAKNALPNPNPRGTGDGYPLSQLKKDDPRGLSMKAWQGKLTGERALTREDLVVLANIFPGCLPSQADVDVFLAVAEKRTPPPAQVGLARHLTLVAQLVTSN